MKEGLQGHKLLSARAEGAQGTPTQSHISLSILVYEDTAPNTGADEGADAGPEVAERRKFGILVD